MLFWGAKRYFVWKAGITLYWYEWIVVDGKLIAWKLSKYGVFSSPFFPVFGPNTGKYGPEKNSVLGRFSGSGSLGL